MLVLAFDTATPCVAIAVVELAATGTAVGEPSRTLAASATVGTNRHGEVLAAGIHSALAEAGVTPGDLAAVAVGLGPGPFTGLRVGIVTAAALGHALGIPAYGCCSLDAVPGPAGVTDYVVVTDARRREVYAAHYSGGQRIDGPIVATAEAALARFPRGIAVVGPDRTGNYPAADRIAAVAVTAVDPALVPLYLRRPDATEPGPAKTVLG